MKHFSTIYLTSKSEVKHITKQTKIKKQKTKWTANKVIFKLMRKQVY